MIPAQSEIRTAAVPASLPACALCGAPATKSIFARESFGAIWRLHECDNCGLCQTVPSPDESQIAEFYAGDYHAELRVAGAAEGIFGPKFRRYVDWIVGFCAPGRALDIGCATGLLVRMLCDRGFQAEGLEMSAASAEWAVKHYGVKVQNELLRDGLFEKSSFDLVIMADVLEHTVTPLSYLGLVHKILRPGGYMFVSFPDIFSAESRYWRLLSKLSGKSWLWGTCHIPLHTWEFTRPTATRMFRRAGFEVAGFRRSQPRPEATGAALRVLSLPTRLLRLPGLNRLFGTQMEFVIRRTD